MRNGPSRFLADRKPFLGRLISRSIGYSRTSFVSGANDSQVCALKEAGCLKIFQEAITHQQDERRRPQFEAALSELNKGDELVLIKLGIAFKSLKECIDCINALQKKGIYVRTLDGLINTRCLGSFAVQVFPLLAGLADFERSLVQERAFESIQRRKEVGGSLGGRPRISSEREGLVLRLRGEGNSYRSIRGQTGLALSTIRRIIVESKPEIA